VAADIASISHELSSLCYPTANHDPECKVHFDREQHRASPNFLFLRSSINARTGTKVPAYDSGKSQVVHRITQNSRGG
jgi:hypothetical protein